jgi:hypothetical protein
LFGAGTLVPIVAHIDERELLENVWPIEFFLFRLGGLLAVLPGEG